MRFALGTNFDPELITSLKDTPVECVFGKLREDVIGGGRPSFALPDINENTVREHIKLVHQNGKEFNYLLNSVCLDNMELTRKTNNEINELLELLKDMKVDWVTISIPYIIDLVRAKMPDVKISVSTFADVDSIQKAKHYERLGVQEITLPEKCNRNFSLLKQLKKSVKLDLQLIATNDCLLSCQYRHHHPIFQSHASQANHISDGYALDYCLLKCTNMRLEDPTQYIKSAWIRPEDLAVYEDLGFDKFKITERLKNTESLVNVVKAYSSRKYSGNLANLLNIRMNESDFVMPDFQYNNKPDFINTDNINQVYKLLFSNKVEIDNEKLDGFIDFFVNKKFDCLEMDCDVCGYCKKVADDVLKVDNKFVDIKKEEFKKVFDSLASGKFFKTEQDEIFWSKETLHFFDKMMKDKPIFIREMARKGIKSKAENIAKEKASSEVKLEYLIEANFSETPKEFRSHVIKGLADAGIKLEEFNEIVEKFELEV